MAHLRNIATLVLSDITNFQNIGTLDAAVTNLKRDSCSCSHNFGPQAHHLPSGTYQALVICLLIAERKFCG